MDKLKDPEELYMELYKDLRKLANQYLKSERSDHTLQPTALVHELWFKLSNEQSLKFNDSQHFFAVSAKMMRQLLVDHARKKGCAKRQKPELEEAIHFLQVEDNSIPLLELEDSLVQLEQMSQRAAKIVEMRFFAGLKNEEIAEVLGVSVPTVKRDWQLAKAFFEIELKS